MYLWVTFHLTHSEMSMNIIHYSSAHDDSILLQRVEEEHVTFYSDHRSGADTSHLLSLLSCHLSSQLASHLVYQQQYVCMCNLLTLKIVRYSCAISKSCELWCKILRLDHNLRILRMHNVISRLRKFADCMEHIYYPQNRLQWLTFCEMSTWSFATRYVSKPRLQVVSYTCIRTYFLWL